LPTIDRPPSADDSAFMLAFSMAASAAIATDVLAAFQARP
jgi:hypothetical protein